MTRSAYAVQFPDISAAARSLARDLARDLAASPQPPGHLSLLNALARAAGFRNFQHLRASAKAEAPAAVAPAADHSRVAAALRHFDAAGQMASWPAKTTLQKLCLWGLWSHLPRGVAMTERHLSAVLNQWHRFGDAAILRRTMVEIGLLTRTADCTDYRRVEISPSPEARALIGHLHRGHAEPVAGTQRQTADALP